MINRKLVEKSFVHQHDMTDCGAACLLSLIRFYGGDSSILHLRDISGTSNTGTTVLGLYQAAQTMGFTPTGAEANGIPDLIAHGKPCILSVIIDQKLSHFVVFYGYDKGKFLISDPAKGVVDMSEEELDKIWTRKCLLLEPNAAFEKKESITGRKKDWIKELIHDDIGLLGAGVAIGLVIAVLGMVMAIFSQKLVDDVLPSRDMTKLVLGLAMVLFLLLVKVGISAIRGKLLLIQKQAFNNRIIVSFFEKILHLPKSFFDTRKTGDMVARLNDTRRIQTVISTLAGEKIINSLVIIVSIVFLFVYSWKVALVALVCLPLFWWIIARNNKKVIAQQRDMMSSYAMSESGFINTISGIADIKGFSRQDSFLKLNEVLYSTFQSKVFALGGSEINIGIWAGISSTVIQVALIAICSLFVYSETMTTGELMAVIGITGTLFPAVASLALVMIPINEAKVAFDRMYEIVDAREEESGKSLSSDYEVNTLELKNMSFRFIGRKRIIDNITHTFKLGEIACLVGESGCGKSTLCQIIERFYKPEEGEILLDGVSVEDIALDDWRNLISVVPQDIFLYNGTILENICFGKAPESLEGIVAFCQKYGFDKFISELPGGLFTLVGEDGINLSGGQKQLVAFARALYKPSKILILDEMTAAMDRRTEKHICNLLDQLRKDHLIIFVTHRMETARQIADSIVVMENGKIAANGTHEELLKFDNFYSQSCKSLNA